MQPTATYPGAQNPTIWRGAPIIALLTSDDDRRLLSLAVSLRGSTGRRVDAWALPDESRTLKQTLRATMLGIRGNSEANRALRYMVDTSARGHHIPVRILPTVSSARSEQLDELTRLPADTLLVTSFTQGGQAPADSSFDEVLCAHPGPLLLMMGCPPQAFTSALFVSDDPSTEASKALSTLCDAVERAYPCWTRAAADLDALEELLAETTRADLVIVSSAASELAVLQPLLNRLKLAASISTVGILLNNYASREPLLQWLRDN